MRQLQVQKLQATSTVHLVEGVAHEYTLRLATQPTGNGEVRVTPGVEGLSGNYSVGLFDENDQEVTSFVFNSSNPWDSPQRLKVLVAENSRDEDIGTGSVTFSVTGGGYDKVKVVPILFDIADNDERGVTITPSNTLSVAEGAMATYTVVLDTQPSQRVSVSLVLEGLGSDRVTLESRIPDV